MPCMDPLAEQEDWNQLEGKVQSLTQKLCYACGNLITLSDSITVIPKNYKKSDFIKLFCDLVPTGLQKWWKQHLTQDLKRVEENMREYVKAEVKRPEEMVNQELAEVFIKKAEKVHAVSDWHKDVFFPYVANRVLDSVVKNRRDEAQRRKETVRKALANMTQAERQEVIDSFK
jgi:hypothetical protein